MTRVLYVDDEPDLREVAVFALSLDRELEVRSAASGAEALSIVEEWRPDLVLLDVMMPGMDGPSTLSLLRKETRHADLPVVFITARVQPKDKEDLVRLGARAVIDKPFDPATLAQIVRSYMD
ncbi:MAG: response regulator [Hydrogenophaga sp.]|nr:response regulator [Erythrobacter sp.]MDZ4122839.1 response regulator [Hydrogenophaga sp.]MDZ4272641.1 response regulator [Erythrobacter sp.]